MQKKKLLASGDAALSCHGLELIFFNEQVAKPGNRNSKNYKAVRAVSLYNKTPPCRICTINITKVILTKCV
jgi:hypothetical protein